MNRSSTRFERGSANIFSPALALRTFGSRTSEIAIARIVDTASVFRCLTPFESDEEKPNTLALPRQQLIIVTCETGADRLS